MSIKSKIQSAIARYFIGSKSVLFQVKVKILANMPISNPVTNKESFMLYIPQNIEKSEGFKPFGLIRSTKTAQTDYHIIIYYPTLSKSYQNHQHISHNNHTYVIISDSAGHIHINNHSLIKISIVVNRCIHIEQGVDSNGVDNSLNNKKIYLYLTISHPLLNGISLKSPFDSPFCDFEGDVKLNVPACFIKSKTITLILPIYLYMIIGKSKKVSWFSPFELFAFYLDTGVHKNNSIIFLREVSQT